MAPRGEYGEVCILEAYDARRGTVVRVKEGHWKADFAGMLGTVQECWGQSEHAAVDVLMEDGRLELFWLPNLDAVEEDIAVQSPRLMLVWRENADERQGSKLPFGYHLERDADMLMLRRPDCSFVAAFSAMGADPFEVEAAVWEDAD